jgi:hypothetical protein
MQVPPAQTLIRATEALVMLKNLNQIGITVSVAGPEYHLSDIPWFDRRPDTSPEMKREQTQQSRQESSGHGNSCIEGPDVRDQNFDPLQKSSP